ALPEASGSNFFWTATLDPEYLIAANLEAVSDATDGTFPGAVNWADGLVAFNGDTATHFSVTPAAGAVPAGQPFRVTVTARDDNGHAAAGYTGTVHFTSSDLLAGLPADYTFTAADHGSHTFTVVLRTRRPQPLQATDVLAPALTGSGTVAATPFDVTALVTIGRGKTTVLANGDLARKLTLHYNGASPLAGPVWVVFDHLKHHVKLRHRDGLTAEVPPLRSPYGKIVLSGGVWSPGQSLTVTLEFVVPPGVRLSYVPRVLAGPGLPSPPV